MFIQMSASKGLKMFGGKAVAALCREYKQYHDMDVFDRVKIDDISPDKKNKTLNAINLIKVKRNGEIKGRTCTNGKQQVRYTLL